jgi:hypothetical protein
MQIAIEYTLPHEQAVESTAIQTTFKFDGKFAPMREAESDAVGNLLSVQSPQFHLRSMSKYTFSCISHIDRFY